MKIRKEKIIKIFKLIVKICILYNIMFLVTTTFSEKDYFKVFGISFLNMNSNLMEEEISQNDLVIVKSASEKDLQKGDIIAYTVNGKIRINKIINENDGYVTKSNKNYYPDIEKVSYNQIIGKKIANISFLGNIINILHSKITSGFILIFLIFNYLYNRYIFVKNQERARKKKKVKRDQVPN